MARDTALDFYRDVFSGFPTYDATSMRSLIVGEPKVEDQTVLLGENEIPFGFRTTRYTRENLITLKIDFKSPFFGLILGPPRIGKGVMGAYLAEMLYYKTGARIISLDSAHELFTHQYPFWSREPEYKQRLYKSFLAQYGLQPRGFKMYQIAPKFLGDVTNIDKQFSWSYDDFKRLKRYDPQNARTILSEMICGADATGPNQSLIDGALEDASVHNWESFYNRMLELRKKQSKDDPLGTTARTAFRGFNDCKRDGLISDDPIDHINLIEIAKNNEWINFVGQIRTVENDNDFMIRYNASVKMFYQTYIVDTKRKHEGATDALLNNMTIYTPEVDSAVPKGGTSSLRPFFTTAILKFGKYHVNSISDVQDIDRIDSSVSKASSIIAGKSEGSNLKVFGEKGLNDDALEMIQKLATKQVTSIGTKASQFAFVGRQIGEPDIIPVIAYAFPPTSDIYDESRYSQIA